MFASHSQRKSAGMGKSGGGMNGLYPSVTAIRHFSFRVIFRRLICDVRCTPNAVFKMSQDASSPAILPGSSNSNPAACNMAHRSRVRTSEIGSFGRDSTNSRFLALSNGGRPIHGASHPGMARLRL